MPGDPDPLADAAARLARARAVLLELAAEDAEAYAAMNELWKLPKADPRRAELPGAAAAAVGVPSAVMATCLSALRLLEELGPRLNKHTLSDAATAAIVLEAAVRAAERMVRVNLPFLGTDEERNAAGDRAQELVREAGKALEQVLGRCA